MSAQATPRLPRIVLAEALSELHAREHRLTAALGEVRHAISTLRAAVEIRQPVPAEENDGTPAVLVRTPAAAAPAGRGRDETVLAAIREHQPCARSTLLDHTGLTAGMLKPSLERLMEAGAVRRLGDKSTARYWTTEGLDRHVAEFNQMPDGSPA